MPQYPTDDRLFVRALRFANLLDDADNKLSPTKANAWGSVVASISTTGGAILAWITGHWQVLDHVLSVAPLVGAHLGAAFTAHHFDKRERSMAQVRIIEAQK